MRILGIEGTAWAASAAVFDAESDDINIETEAFQPDHGGIHPREAAEHMGEAIPDVVDRALENAAGDIDAVAFSQGPGLGPCLRVVGTAARALAGTLDVPLVGVNHMVAHLEIGRHRSGFEHPVCLNASGANAHLLYLHRGRYRVLGETMDTGVGNAIDKFTRHLGWSHPGGPKVEARASEGSYVDLPYVVKGMDFSFAGLSSAAQEAVDDGVPVEDVCCGLQETVFGMLTEVSERALALTGADELVLGGGVGQNNRLRGMLSEMCTARGADFHAPEPRLLRDNAGMIAVLGAKMYDAGATVPVAESAVDPDFRPDEVDISWRRAPTTAREPTDGSRGAEATVTVTDDTVCKERVAKSYRHPALDDRLRTERTRAEARLTSAARRAGVPTPVLRDVDVEAGRLELEHVGSDDLAAALTPAHAERVGAHLARLHDAGIIHGDPTTRNVRVGAERVSLIDFGLGYHSNHVEDRAMDLHVFRGSVAGTAADPAPSSAAVEMGYVGADVSTFDPERVLDRLDDVARRGRYR